MPGPEERGITVKKALKISALIIAGLTLLAIFGGIVSLYVYGVPDIFRASITAGQNTTAEITQNQVTTLSQTTAQLTETTQEATTLPQTEPTTVPTTVPETEPPTVPETKPTTAPTSPPAPKPYQLDAKVTFVYDLTNEQLLQQRGELDTKVYPASITKLFNAYISLQYLSPEDVITIGQELTLLEEDASDAGLKEGYVLTVEQLLKGMLLPSGCDAACVLAVAAGRVMAQDPQLDYQAAYALYMEKMNEQLQALGMTGTHFTNPYGYHSTEHYTTARDLIAITRLCLEVPEIVACTSCYKAKVTLVSGQTLEWKNTNYVINPYSKFYVKKAVGMKTGSTNAAGACLLTAYRLEDRTVVICTMGGSYFNGRYNDTAYLYKEYCT